MPHFLLEDKNADDTYGCSKFKAMGLRIPPALIDTKSSNFRMWLHDLCSVSQIKKMIDNYEISTKNKASFKQDAGKQQIDT